MINKIFCRLQRPEKGWDPVSTKYAKQYANECYAEDVNKTLADVEELTGQLVGKSVLDLGAGPGQYSAAFAKRGAKVIWHDISHNYAKIFKEHFSDLNLKQEIGYLEESKGQYDLVFNRVCFCYSLNDQAFVRHIYSLVKKGGYGYCILINEENLKKLSQQGIRKKIRLFQFYLNNIFNIKIGHPMITNKKIKKNFSKLNCQYLSFKVVGHLTYVKFKKF